MTMKGTMPTVNIFLNFVEIKKKKCTKNVVVKYNCITNILCQIKSKLFFTFYVVYVKTTLVLLLFFFDLPKLYNDNCVGFVF